MKVYSEQFKSAMVAKIAEPDGISASALLQEVGIPHQTLSRWEHYALARKGRSRTSADHSTTRHRSSAHMAMWLSPILLQNCKGFEYCNRATPGRSA